MGAERPLDFEQVFNRFVLERRESIEIPDDIGGEPLVDQVIKIADLLKDENKPLADGVMSTMIDILVASENGAYKQGMADGIRLCIELGLIGG